MAQAEGNFGVNQPYIRAHRFICSVANQNYALPDIPVPEGMQLLLKGWFGNGNVIYITGSAAERNNVNDSYPLLAGETLALRVQNAKNIYAAAGVAGEGLAIIVECSQR